MQDKSQRSCDCDAHLDLNRRTFLKTAGVAAAAASSWPVWATAKDSPSEASAPESFVKQLYDTLTDEQKKVVAFDWDHQDGNRGLLRTHVSNNWHITKPTVLSNFFTKDQQDIIEALWTGLYNPEWLPKIKQQLQDDAGGYGKQQNIAIFGKPGDGKFEFVMTGRHMTIRCDGNSTDHMAFGGPIFYGHAAQCSNEKADHPGNVYWPQAQAANKVFEMLDGKQRKQALVTRTPQESAVGFRGSEGQFPGIPVSELTSDQQAEVQKVLGMLIEPNRQADQAEAMQCLKTAGGLEKCALSFYSQNDIGDDGVWDNWRLEGPSFVWYFRGAPHVHVWVNIADDASVKTNAQG